jgi:hypothetical protein
MAAFRAALAPTGVNGVHAGRRAGQKRGSVLTSGAMTAWLRLTPNHEVPACS